VDQCTLVRSNNQKFFNYAYACTYTHTALSNTIGRFKTSQYHPASALISWKAAAVQENVTTVTDYTVQVEGPDSTQVISRSENITSVRISDLRPCTQYTFVVSAVTLADSTTAQRGETAMP
jgi:hypothetical protein